MRKITTFVAALTLVAGFAASSVAYSGVVRAAEPAGGSGLSLSPVRTDLTINPGESKSITVTVKNVTSATTEYEALINDFVVAADNELGHPALILDNDKYAPSHSLKRYIAPVENVTVAPNESKNVKVTINIPKDAAAGGHYGSVRFVPKSDVSGQNITLSASVGSIVLVKVPGDIKEDMVIDSFDVRQGKDAKEGSGLFTQSKNLYSVVRFNNRGNSHEQPFGKVRLLKNGKVLQETEINNLDPRANVLPDSIRRFDIKLDKVGNFGKYTVEGNFGFGTNGQLLSSTTSFWVIPFGWIVAGLAALVLLVAAIFLVPRAIKRYNRNIVRKAGRR